MTLSTRGQALLKGPFPEYLSEHFARSPEPWHPQSNPDGYLALCVAENKLVWDLFEGRVRQARDVPSRAFGYDDTSGSPQFRQQLATFLGQRLAGRTLQPDHVIALAGAGSILESTFYALANPGEGVLIPTPSYAGFWMDLEVRDGLHVVPVHTRSDNGFRLTVDVLERAVETSPHTIRALLLTNPDNPRGEVLPPDHVASIVDWAESRDLHVVMDELYAFSVFGDRTFESILHTRPSLGEKLHVVWAFSKDFAASGLRCGVLVSENDDLRTAVRGLSYWSCVSGDTQFLLGDLLEDASWLSTYLSEMPKRLAASHNAAAAALTRHRIPHVPAEAGFFLLADFRKYLPEPTKDAEHALWRRFLDEAKVNLTPGGACRIDEPGFMRLCHAGVSNEATEIAVARIAALL